MSYKISDGRRMRRCPKCKRYKTGSLCMCGYKWQGEKKEKGKVTRINANIPQCKICNAIGDYSGYCKMHWEQQGELAYKQRMESYRRPGENDRDIDILTGKIIVPTQKQQEEASDET